MAARKRNGVSGPYIKKIRKSEDVQRQQLSILCSLPGVGETFATRMLEKFGTRHGRALGDKVRKKLLKVEGMGGVKGRANQKRAQCRRGRRKGRGSKRRRTD